MTFLALQRRKNIFLFSSELEFIELIELKEFIILSIPTIPQIPVLTVCMFLFSMPLTT
jgi:hypothetical protein